MGSQQRIQNTDGSQLNYLCTLSLLPTAITTIQKAVQRKGAYSGDKWKKAVYSRESAIIGILEEAVTGHIVSTPMPASTVEELTQLRIATSHHK